MLRHTGTAYRRLSWVLSLLVLVSFTSASTAEPNRAVDPGINAYYLDTTAERWMNTFESNGREFFDRRHEILDVVGLRPGMSVADVGAGTGTGTGLFTMLFAEAVGPEGKVYAVDISAGFIAAIERRAAQSKSNAVYTLSVGELLDQTKIIEHQRTGAGLPGTEKVEMDVAQPGELHINAHVDQPRETGRNSHQIHGLTMSIPHCSKSLTFRVTTTRFRLRA